MGLEFSPHGIKVDDRGATNLPGVWAAGDVTGQAWLAHAASRMAEVVVNNISGQTDQMRHDSMPAVVYTSPEVAVVGLTKEEAEERGIKTRTGRIPMAINARYIAENPDEGGLCKVVLEDGTNRLLGVHMVGGACSEMIFGATAMIETELREEEIDEIVFPHPTTSEIMKDVFMAVRDCFILLFNPKTLKIFPLCLSHKSLNQPRNEKRAPSPLPKFHSINTKAI